MIRKATERYEKDRQPEVLRQSYLSLPQITELAQSLVPCGLSGRSLTVEEFCAEYVSS